MTEIKGIGFQTASYIIAEMPSVENFENARQYAAFAGLTPLRQQSGSSINKKSRICKIGSKKIRSALYMPAIAAKNTNEHFSKFCYNLKQKGKSGKVIVVAVMRKILHIFFGILKHKTKFNPTLV